MNILNKSSHKRVLHMSTSIITVLTHIEDNKFLWVNIFQNIILYTNIYIYTLCRKLYTCLHEEKKKIKSFEIIYILFFFLLLLTRDSVESLQGNLPSRIQRPQFVPDTQSDKHAYSKHSYSSETVG